MAQCPNCQATITEDFGLVSCSECGVSLMIGIDGEAQLNSPEEEAVSALATSNEEMTMEQQPDYESESELVSVEGDSEVLASTEENFAESSVASSTQWFEDMSGELSQSEEEIPDIKNATFESPAPPAVAQSTGEAMQEIAEFANSDNSMWSDGNIRYRVFVSDIDSVELKAQVAEALSDERFRWNVSELISSIESGQLKFESLSAPKAFALIKSLKPYKLTIAWEQNVLQTHT